MKRNFTIEDIKNSKVAHLNDHVLNPPKSGSLKKKSGIPVQRKSSKILSWLDLNLQYWANEHKVTLEKEYRFCEGRKYKSDYAIPSLKILIEYEGGIFMQRGGHNSHTGIQRDIDKYALAHTLGYTVIRLTAINYTTVLEQLNQLI